MSDSLPVAKALQPIIPDGALVRGRTVLCSGDAAMSTALLMASAPTQAGSWLAVVGVSDFGLVSACEQGVALQRTEQKRLSQAPDQHRLLFRRAGAGQIWIKGRIKRCGEART